jgi:hypothetical protein
MSVRTNSSKTSYASGFGTIGAGTRLDGGRTTGGPAEDPGAQTLFQRDLKVAGLEEMEMLANEAGYDAQPGALAAALGPDIPLIAIGNSDQGLDPPAPLGYGRWSLLAAMDPEGTVGLSATSPALLESANGAPYGVRTSAETIGGAVSSFFPDDGSHCFALVIDPGDLTRADEFAATFPPATEQRNEALLAADGIVGLVRERMSPRDLLLITSVTSPAWDRETHLGVAIAEGPEFPAGSSMESASTRAPGFVTLPDIAPAVLEHFGRPRPGVMLGRPFVALEGHNTSIGELTETDEEAVYSHGIIADVTTAFVIAQVLICFLIVLLLWHARREPPSATPPRVRHALELAALSVVAFPLTTYLASPLEAHTLRLEGLVPAMLAIDLVLVALVSVLIAEPLYRLMALTTLTIAVMTIDLVLGGRLQFMSVFGQDPINAGRFAGFGNLAFAIFGTSCVVTAALTFYRWSGHRWVIPAIASLFALGVIVDGAPQLGSDVGGVLALVPTFIVTMMLITGKKPRLRTVIMAAVVSLVVVGLFLVVDLARPPEAQTHLARLYEDARARGGGVFLDTIVRKARANLRVFTSTIWTYLVPPALAVIAYLLVRPRGSWNRLARDYPPLRAGLIGALLLAILGFAVNDSGIVVPAMVLSFLVPMALLIHLKMEREETA